MNSFISQEKKETSKQLKNQNSNNTNHRRNRYCQNCGAKLDERDLFCTECGGKVEIIEETQSQEKPKLEISSDRMNAILNAGTDFKSTFSTDIEKFSKDNESSTRNLVISQSKKIKKNDSRLGYYLSQDTAKKEYLIIESIDGNHVTGTISDLLNNGKYGNEFFSGTITDNHLEINSIQKGNTNCNLLWDLHFTGLISENSISGIWSRIEGHHEKMTYNKIL